MIELNHPDGDLMVSFVGVPVFFGAARCTDNSDVFDVEIRLVYEGVMVPVDLKLPAREMESFTQQIRQLQHEAKR